MDRRLRRRHLPPRPRRRSISACATTTARPCSRRSRSSTPTGNQTGEMSPAERRRLSLEHVLAARRRQLPPERVGAVGREGATTAATTRSWRRASSAPAVPSITPAFDFGFDAAGNRVNFVQTSSNANLRIDPDLKAPYSDQYIVQFEQELIAEPRRPGQLRAQARRGLHRRGRTSPAVRRGVPYIDNVGRRRDRRDRDGLPPAVATRQTACSCRPTRTGMYTRYNGVTFMVTKRMSNNWQACSRWCCPSPKAGSASSARATPTDRAKQPGRNVRTRSCRAERLRQHRRPADRRPPGRGEGAADLSLPVGHHGRRQLAASDRPGLRAAGARERPRLPDGAADQHGTEHGRSPRRRRQPDRPARAEGVRAPEPPLRLDVFLDALNLTNSDQAEGVGSVLGTSTAFGVPTRYIPPRRLQLGAKIVW